MEMKIMAAGIGATIRGVVGANIFTGITMKFRHTREAKPHLRLGINSGPQLSQTVGTVVFAWVEIDWFFIDTKVNTGFASPRNLINKTVEIILSGMVLGSGKVDIKISKIDDSGDQKIILMKRRRPTVDSCNIQFSTTGAYGPVLELSHKNIYTGS